MLLVDNRIMPPKEWYQNEYGIYKPELKNEYD